MRRLYTINGLTALSKRVRRRIPTVYFAAFCFLRITTVTSFAQADSQVSSEFSRVAKALGKRLVADELESSVCADVNTDAKPVCEAIADSVSTAFAMAVDQKVDEAALSNVLVDLAVKLTQAAAADAAKELFRPILDDAVQQFGAVAVDCKLSTSRLATELSDCLIAQTLPREGKAAACQTLETYLKTLAGSCGSALQLSVSSEAARFDPTTLIQSIKKTIASDTGSASSYRALLILHQLVRFLQGGAETGYYASASHALQMYDDLFATVDSPYDESIFSDSEMDRILIPESGNAVCTNLDAVRARLNRWQSERYRVFLTLSRALAKGLPLPAAELAKIPTDLPDPACPNNHPVAKQVTTLRRYAITYQTDVKLTAELDHIVMPTLLSALALDYVRDRDKTLLVEHFNDFSLRALARIIAAIDLDAFLCDNEGNCTSLDPKGKPRRVILPEGVTPEILHALVEERFSPSCEHDHSGEIIRIFILWPKRLQNKHRHTDLPDSFKTKASSQNNGQMN